MRQSVSYKAQNTVEASAKLMGGVYGWMSFGVALSAIITLLMATSSAETLKIFLSKPVVYGAIGLELVTVLAMSFLSHKMSPSALKGAFIFYSALTGITVGAVVISFMGFSMSPTGAVTYSAAGITTVASVFGLASVSFIALALFGTVTKSDLGFMRTFLMIGLIGVIGLGIVSIFVPGLNFIMGILGLVVFGGLTAYESQQIKQASREFATQGLTQSQEAERFKIMYALTMYLNFINIFLSLLRLLGDRE